MPLPEEMMKIDQKAYAISRRLDENVADFCKEKINFDKTKEMSLAEVLDNSSNILKLLDGYENPPYEILQDLTPEGISSLFRYYISIKKTIMDKYSNEIYLTYSGIKVGKDLLAKLNKFTSKIENMTKYSKSLKDFALFYSEIKVEMLAEQNHILTITNINAKEKELLFSKFEHDIDLKIIPIIVDRYGSISVNNLNADIRKYCVEEKIPYSDNSLDIFTALKILKKIHVTADHYRNGCINLFKDNNSCNKILELIDSEKGKIKKIYNLPTLSHSEANQIVEYINKIEKRFSYLQRPEEISLAASQLKNDYQGVMANEIKYYIEKTEKKLLSSLF